MIQMNTTTTTNTKSPSTPPANPELYKKFQDWLLTRGHSMTNAQIARLLGANATQVSRYRNQKFEGDIERFESALLDFLKSDKSSRHVEHTYFDCDVSRNIHSILNLIRSTGDIGLIHSPAGRGKTAACQLYAQQNPTSIYIFVTTWCNTPKKINQHLFRSISSQRWPGNTDLMSWVAEQMTGSRRLIILDNAQRLTNSCRHWLFDFADVTGCSIAFVGNPEILTAIKKNDQHYSRIGIVREPKGKDAAVVARKLIQMHCPEGEEDLPPLAVKVLKGPGHCRALVKQLLLTREIIMGGLTDPTEAFRAAHTQLVREYDL